MFWSAVEGNRDRSRQRWLRGRASPLSETMGPVTLDDESVPQIPSDGEMISAEQQIPLPLSPPFDLVTSKFVLLRRDGRDG